MIKARVKWSGNESKVCRVTVCTTGLELRLVSVHLLYPPRMAKKGLLGSPRALPK